MISDKHKFIYIHVPKCGGMSMTHHLLPYSEDYPSGVGGKNASSIMVRRPNEKDHRYFGRSYMHATANELKDFMGDDKYNDYYKFTTIRNTYDRLVSLYFWATNDVELNPNKFKDIIGYNGLRNRPPVSYKNGKMVLPRGSSPINFFVCDENDEIMIDDVFLIGDMNDNMNTIYKKIGVEGELMKKKSNTSKHKHYSHYYTQELIDVVDYLYEIEIKKFNFEFINKTDKNIKSNL